MAILIDRLRAVYGRPGDADTTTVFQIDDKDGDDVYPGFCDIWASLPDPRGENFVLNLENAPHNDEVVALVKSVGGQIDACPISATIKIFLHNHDGQFVRDLAKAIRRVIARGQRYAERNWKWITRRTAGSLKRFADLLDGKRIRRRRSDTNGKGG